ncbi:MAG: hypothetical protein V4660_11130 [Pseudomonadota bacterium]
MPVLIARLLGIFLLAITINSSAIDIPKSLEEWKPWVLEKHSDINCPFLFSDATRTCTWPSELHINASSSGVKFTLHVEAFKNDWVALPGNMSLWPQNVSDNNSKTAVRDNASIPEIYLTIGSHEISGEIRWTEIPRTLQIPEQTGIVQLTLQGKSVTTPAVENGNQLWLSASETQTAVAHQDTFNLRVFRKINDAVPLQIITQLQIEVSGKERELQLGQLLLTGFTATEFQSSLPARIEKDGSLRIQVKPGSWELTLVSQSTTPINELTFKSTSALWPQQEVWVFEAQRQLRSVQISGVQTIDPQQTQLPEEWKHLPAYLVTPEAHFKIEELQRGINKDAASELTLTKEMWLSSNGKEFIIQDRLRGTTQKTRLETINPYELTTATIAEKSQLITHLANSKNAGVEIRTHDINLTGVSHLPRNLTLPVSGWSEDFNSVTTNLYLPPGWSLFTATDTSSENGSWISQWTLWDMFLVLIIAVAIGRTTKLIYGALAAITLLIIYQRTGAPVYIWLNLVAAIALISFVSGKFKNFIVKYTYVSFILLALILLPFAVREARAIINPQLEHEAFYDFEFSVPFIMHSDNKRKSAPAPAPTVEANRSYELAEEMAVDSISSEDMGKVSKSGIAESLQRTAPVAINKEYDPNQQTQTGVAIPAWKENRVYLEWTGPVKANETSKLFLVAPFINRIGYLLSVLLPLLLSGILLQHFFQALGKNITLPTFKKSSGLAILPCILIAGLWMAPNQSAQADVVIDQTILKELEERLTAPPRCLPNCAAIESLSLTLNNDQLTLDMIVHSNDLIALPLPAEREQWWPNQVIVDGKSATLIKTPANSLLVSLPKGRHNLIIKANLQGRDALNLQFPLPLHNVVSTTQGWEVSGAPAALQASQSLQLQRVERNEIENKSEHLRPDPIAPFVIVRRELHLGLEWTLVTTVTRVAPATGAINIEVPVIEGEQPLTTQLNSNGKISVHLEANEYASNWSSTIKQATPLQLQAAQNTSWVEIWALDASPIWHTETTGIAPIQFAENENIPIWQPWPGETLSINVTRPAATKGSYITIDSATLTHELGKRSNASNLDLSIRTNQGGQYNFTMPQGAKLSNVNIDGNPLSISAVSGLIKIPLLPGEQRVAISWKMEESVSFFSKSPQFSLEHGSSNQHIHINLPNNRWPLFVGGPMVGPSILIWGMLFVVVLIAFALGRSGLTPLKSYQWVLLSLGVCTLSFVTFIVVAIWLILLQQRGKLQTISSKRKFKLMQAGLFTISAIALLCLIGTIPAGLLGSPDMHIVGDNYYGGHFSWYQDHSDLAFPSAWIISLPLWCYKVTILLWALWLASALLGWIRWGWQQLSHHGLWYAPEEIIINTAIIKHEENNSSV